VRLFPFFLFPGGALCASLSRLGPCEKVPHPAVSHPASIFQPPATKRIAHYCAEIKIYFPEKTFFSLYL
jgi:hypothetical protein